MNIQELLSEIEHSSMSLDAKAEVAEVVEDWANEHPRKEAEEGLSITIYGHTIRYSYFDCFEGEMNGSDIEHRGYWKISKEVE